MDNMCIMDNMLWIGQSITFKESAKLYPNQAEMNREGKKKDVGQTVEAERDNHENQFQIRYREVHILFT